SLCERVRQRCEAIDDQRRMRLRRGTEVGFDPEMDLQVLRLEPTPAPFGEVRRLRHLRHPEDPFVEVHRLRLSSWRHCELDVIQTKHLHETFPTPSGLSMGSG